VANQQYCHFKTNDHLFAYVIHCIIINKLLKINTKFREFLLKFKVECVWAGHCTYCHQIENV